ncbi:MAG: LamG domain-containing protein, partial [Phycisphaerales bacterium]
MSRRVTYLICCVFVLSLIQTASAELAGWWKFDEGVGIAAADSSENGHDGTINGNPVWTTGQYSGALQFDGTDDYVMCNLLDIDTSVTGGMTVCGWINKTAGGDRKLCSNRQVANAAGGGFTCSIYNDYMEMDICSATARTLARDSGGATVPAGTWVHLAWVFDDAGDLFKEYHNGVLVDSDAVTVSVGVSTSQFRIGADSPSLGLYYLGAMDDWRVYDHALSDAELQDAMAGRGPNAELAVDPSPEDEATDVIREVVLSWTPSEWAATHDVYLGTVLADVENASRDNPIGVLVGEGQSDTAFDAGRLEFGQVYYWRVDEVNAAPDNTIFKGEVWSFTTEVYAYPITGLTATASSQQPTSPAIRTIDGSGLDASDQHGVDLKTMWVTPGGLPAW